jgi:hypothetical protein
MSAKVTLKGYISEKPAPAKKTSAGGKEYVTYQVAAKTGKDKETGKNKYSYFSCRDMRADALVPEAKAFVEVVGGLSVSTNTKGDKTYTNLDVFVDEITVAPPREGEASQAAAPKKEPWED